MKKSGVSGAGRIFKEHGVQSICQSVALNAFGISGPKLGAVRSERINCKIMAIAFIMAILVVPLSAQEKPVGVLIIGDSISMGYTWEVRKFLAGKANVQHPNVNCGPTEFGLEHVRQWIGDSHWDVIYFNFGLHDLKYLDEKGDYVTPDKGKQVASIEQYQANLKRIIGTLQSTGAKLIFATTTPVPSGSNGRVQGDEMRYNTGATEVMRQMGIETDDLWSVVNPSLATLQQPHNVHFTAEGYRVLGAEVAGRIEHDLPNPGRP
jgi:hypothetical protein